MEPSTRQNAIEAATAFLTREVLLRLIDTESKLPGRKTVLYLSEGLTKPANRPEVMQRVIGAANRGNTPNLTTHIDSATHPARLHGAFLSLLKTPAGDVVNKVSAKSRSLLRFNRHERPAGACRRYRGLRSRYVVVLCHSQPDAGAPDET